MKIMSVMRREAQAGSLAPHPDYALMVRYPCSESPEGHPHAVRAFLSPTIANDVVSFSDLQRGKPHARSLPGATSPILNPG